ncbi:hypothetical protein [Pantoea sp. 1B4]|uniref:hypothetical protein n=1 Tax=Pantoea sp. 1B4 TaxID=2804760 RepID=UPI001AA4EB80|nr:hypothetical protein [Pantoea sp. 1B4]MBN1087777.1 hypothetical protein [Pantoea sp. 1B4]
MTIWSKIKAALLLFCFYAAWQTIIPPSFPLFFAAYARYFPQKADKGEKIPPQGRQWPGRSLECAQFAKNRQFRRFLH